MKLKHSSRAAAAGFGSARPADCTRMQLHAQSSARLAKATTAPPQAQARAQAQAQRNECCSR